MSVITDICDAVATDVNANVASLPTHKTWKYAAPLVVPPDVCPLLTVSSAEVEANLETTESDYANGHILNVVWFEDFTDTLTSGKVDEAKASRALSRADDILTRLETYGVAIPGLAHQTDATVVRVRRGMTQGGVWCQEVRLRVTAWT